MTELISNFNPQDWPNLIVGSFLGAVLTAVLTFVVWFLTRIYESWISSKDLPYPISGTWYSAEFDPREGDVLRESRNAYTEVRVKRGLGGTFSIYVVKQLHESDGRAEISWKFIGKLQNGDTLIGKWQSTVKYTKRYGAAIIKFLDYGRAAGYWIGPVGKDYPTYGYWIMARRKEDVRDLSQKVIEDTQFDFADVVGYVIGSPANNYNKID